MRDSATTPGPQYIYDSEGRVIRRIIHSGGNVITQIPQPNGEWWNITIERVTGR